MTALGNSINNLPRKTVLLDCCCPDPLPDHRNNIKESTLQNIYPCFVVAQTRRLTPAPSVIGMTLLALLYMLLAPDISLLMNYVGFTTWLAIGAAVLCLPYLRWKRPDMERPIKVSFCQWERGTDR